jgi:hypothetical protein
VAKIGSITAKVTASTDGLVTGLQKAQTILNGSIAKMQNRMKDFATMAAGVFTGNLLTDALKGGMGRLVGIFTEGQDAVLTMGKAARKAGVDIGSMQVLSEAMGGDAEKAAEAFLKLNEAIGKAAVEGETGPFERLGLDALELSGMAADKRLSSIAEKLGAIQDPIARARAGTALFGDQFKEVADVLADGGKLLDITGKQLGAFGAAFSEQQLAAAKEADQAFRQLSYLYKGLVTQIGAAIAPIVAELSKMFKSLADYGLSFDGLRDKIVNIAEVLAKVGAFIREAFANPDLIIKAWDVIFNYIKAGLYELAGTIANELGKLVRMKDAGANLLGQASRAKFKADIGFFGGGGLIEELGATNSFKKIEELFGKIRNRITEVKNVAKNNNPIELFRESMEKLKESMKTGLDTFLEDSKKIAARMKFGRDRNILDAMDEQLSMQALGQKVMALANSSRPEVKFAGAMQAGSRDAYTAIIANQFTQRESVQELIARLQREQLEQQKLQVQYGRETAEALRQLEVQGLN